MFNHILGFTQHITREDTTDFKLLLYSLGITPMSLSLKTRTQMQFKPLSKSTIDAGPDDETFHPDFQQFILFATEEHLWKAKRDAITRQLPLHSSFWNWAGDHTGGGR